MTISREHIAATADLIRPYIRTTPVIEVDAADFGCPGFTLVLVSGGNTTAVDFGPR